MSIKNVCKSRFFVFWKKKRKNSFKQNWPSSLTVQQPLSFGDGSGQVTLRQLRTELGYWTPNLLFWWLSEVVN